MLMKTVDVKEDLRAERRAAAERFRRTMTERGTFVVRLLSSPGSGKTTLLEKTAQRLGENFSVGILVGDVETARDAERLAPFAPSVQITTGGACHLESDMIQRAVAALALDELDLIIVENVGNLVCPTEFYLGEHAKVMILSVPEGHDKPYKYPNIFQISEAVILNKVDTMPVFDFDEDEFRSVVTSLNPKAPIFPISATKGEGIDDWVSWLAERIEQVRTAAGKPAR